MHHDSACLDLFMLKAKKHELLTPEQEITLGRKVQAMIQLKESGKPASEFNFQEKRIWSSGLRAKTKMIEANVRLSVHLAIKMFKSVHARSGTSGMDCMDLIQEGNIGLATAVEKYDPEKGYRFSTYAYWWIKQAMTRAIQSQERTIRIPEHAHATIRKAMKAESKMLKETGIKPTLSEIAKAINVDRETLQFYLSSSQRTKSLEGKARQGSQDDSAFAEILADPKSLEGIESKISFLDVFNIDLALAFLEPKERDIICSRYGINGREPATLTELSRKYGISSERVRQISEQAMRRMRLKMMLANNLANRETLAAV